MPRLWNQYEFDFRQPREFIRFGAINGNQGYLSQPRAFGSTCSALGAKHAICLGKGIHGYLPDASSLKISVITYI